MKLSWDVNRMSSFAVVGIGYLARNPEVVSTDRGTFCRFCLTCEDYTEEDEQGRYTVIVQSVWFVATHLIGAAIADRARKGDQLFVEGKIRRHHWTANGSDNATFVVTGFRFGARKGSLGAPSTTASSHARAFDRRVHRTKDLPAEIAKRIQDAEMNPAHEHLNGPVKES
jgi:single-stranded DNA-binding protein